MPFYDGRVYWPKVNGGDGRYGFTYGERPGMNRRRPPGDHGLIQQPQRQRRRDRDQFVQIRYRDPRRLPPPGARVYATPCCVM